LTDQISCSKPEYQPESHTTRYVSTPIKAQVQFALNRQVGNINLNNSGNGFSILPSFIATYTCNNNPCVYSSSIGAVVPEIVSNFGAAQKSAARGESGEENCCHIIRPLAPYVPELTSKGNG